jgi:hypothetical protein
MITSDHITAATKQYGIKRGLKKLGEKNSATEIGE